MNPTQPYLFSYDKLSKPSAPISTTKLKKLENLYQKNIKNKWSQIFNNVCLTEYILPKYIKNRKYG